MMDRNQSLILAAVIFAVIAILHLLRAAFGLEAVIAGFNVPAYVSYIFALVAGYLAWHMYNAGR